MNGVKRLLVSVLAVSFSLVPVSTQVFAAPPGSTPGGGAFEACDLHPDSCGFASGDGTSALDPYTIDDCTQLNAVRWFLNSYFQLNQNVDCDGTSFNPIGNADGAFIGHFDGNGYTISNLTISDTGFLGTGLFGATEGATISALRLADSAIGVADSSDGSYSVGSIVGFATNTTISDVTTDNVSVTAADNGAVYIGGLVGYCLGSTVIERSNFSGQIDGGAGQQNGNGGIAGITVGESIIRNSYATGVNYGDSYFGGLVGVMEDNSQVQKSYAANTLHATGDFVGGLVGLSDGSNTTIINSFVVPDIYIDSIPTNLGAITGNNHGVITNSSYISEDPNQPILLACAGANDGTITDCSTVANADAFKGNNDNATLHTWDTPDPWNLHEAGQLPTFAIGVVACDDPTSQGETTLFFSCEFQREMKHHYSGSVVSKQFRYRTHGSSDDWTYKTWPADNNAIVITGLQPSMAYDVDLHVNWTIGASEWTGSTAQLTTGSAGSDSDHDSATDSDELSGPNYADSNNDGLTDANQKNVASLRNQITGKYVVLESSGCSLGAENTANATVSISAEAGDHKDPAFAYPAGLMKFSVSCSNTACYPCVNTDGIHLQCCPASGNEVVTMASVNVTEYWFGDYQANNFVVRKYNSTTHAYSYLPGVTTTNVTIGGQSALKVTYTIADNGPFDEDPAVNKITDPSGPAFSSIDAPDTGLGASHNLLQQLFR